jgi:7,8-dihydropterin-6-yl-methyl-4-(beta-D-ribofuranosyl)aminobenzene 5'-phosphate synthase
VLAHPGIFAPRLGRKDVGGTVVRKFIGIRHRREHLEELGARFRLESGWREIAADTYLTGAIPRVVPFETGDPDLLVPDGDALVPDPVPDDQALVLRTPRGLVVLLGCAHAGLLNTLRYARERTGEERIRAVFGGTHLGFLDAARQEETIRELAALRPELVAVSHCTGLGPLPLLAAAFSERLAYGHVGRAFRLD